MFGLLNICANCTSKADHLIAQRHYCGLCNTLGSKYGFFYRWLTNYDASFYSLLYSAQSKTSLEHQKCPLRFQKTSTTENIGLLYGSAVSMLMAKTSVDDDIADNNSLSSRVLRSFIDKKMPEVYLDLNRFGLDLKYINTQIMLQQDLEREETSTIETLASPTMNVVGEIISHTARLAGKEENVSSLHGLGAEVGRIMYVLDSVNDLTSDVKEGNFNPFVKTWKINVASIRSQANKIVKDSIESIRESVNRLNVVKHGVLVRETLGSGLLRATEFVCNPIPYGSAYPLSLSSLSFGSLLEDSAPRYQGKSNCWTSCPPEVCCFCWGGVEDAGYY